MARDLPDLLEDRAVVHEQPSAPTSATIVVLRCERAGRGQQECYRAAKTFYRRKDGSTGKQDFSLGWRFRVRLHTVTGIHELYALLQRLEADPYAFLVRALPKPSIRLDKGMWLRRRKSGEDAPFMAIPQPWLCADFDKVALPPGLDPVQALDAVIAWLLAQLPPELRGATCVVQTSSSYGLRQDVVSFHLWYWLNRGMGYDELKRWAVISFLDDLPLDIACLRDVQPLYVARPAFRGMPDPLPSSRLRLIEGVRDVAVLPDPPAVEARIERIARRQGVPRERVALDLSDLPGDWRAKLAAMGDGPYRFGFHGPLLSASAAYVAAHGEQADAKVFIAAARAALAAAPQATGREDDLARYGSDAYLEALIESARAKVRRGELSGKSKALIDLDPEEVSLLEAPDLLPLGEARTHVVSLIDGAVKRISAYHERQAQGAAGLHDEPPQLLGEAGVGVGKSAAAARSLLAFLAADPERRVAYVVPEHRLADEVVARVNEVAGARIAYSWRGVAQADPDEPDVAMCRRYAEVEKFLGAGGTLERVCGGPRRGWCRHHPKNPHRLGSSCAYVRQRSTSAQVWVVPFAMLASAPPQAMRREGRAAFDLVVLDEGPWLALLAGCDEAYRVPLAWLDPEHWPDLVTPDAERATFAAAIDGAELRAMLTTLKARLAAAPFGEVEDVILGLDDAPVVDPDTCAAGAKGVWRYKVGLDREARPSMDRAALDALTAAASFTNRRVAKVARLLEVLGRRIRGGPRALLRRTTMTDSVTGTTHDAIALRWRRAIHEGWSVSPVLYLDATPHLEVARCWLPRLEPLGAVHAEAANCSTVQLVDATFGYRAVTGDDPSASAARAMLLRVLQHLARRHRGRGQQDYDVFCGLPLTARKAVEALDARNRPLPGQPRQVGDRTGLLHYGAERGVDLYGGVAVSVVVSRPAVPPRDVETMAGIAFDREIERLPDDARWYPTRPVRRLERTTVTRLPGFDGLLGAMPVDFLDPRDLLARQHYYPDPAAEAVRWATTEAAVLQMLGRDRSVNRTPGRPVARVVLTSLALPLPLDGILKRADIEGRLVDTVWWLLDMHGVVPAHAEAVAALYPERYKDSQSVRDAIKGDLSYDPALATAMVRVRAGNGRLGSRYPPATIVRVTGTRQNGAVMRFKAACTEEGLEQIAAKLEGPLELAEISVAPLVVAGKRRRSAGGKKRPFVESPY